MIYKPPTMRAKRNEMEVVKITHDEDGRKVHDPKWHYVTNWADAPRTLCGGEVFGEGEGSAVFKTKQLKKGSITCGVCIEFIKEIKSIPL